jgi:DHA1 family bicyclomycin/chloramphenicol resistance-like MFS transporter
MSTPEPRAAAPAEAGGAAAAAMNSRAAAFALALLLGLQPVSTDVYLPALPALARELAASMPQAQLTMSALILAFGLAQLVWGPLADRFGRRPVLLAGLALYALASLGSAAAGHIESLIVWRALQGASMAAGVVAARAMVRDLYAPAQGARVMSWALSGLGVLAVIGPAAGGVAATALGWRAALALVAAFGAFALAWVVWRVPETLGRPNPQALHPGPLLAAWSRIARHPAFVAWTLLVSFTYAGLFMFLAGAPFVYVEVLGLSPALYGLAMASAALAYIVGTWIGRRWLARHGMVGAVQRGAWLTALGGASLAAAAVLGLAGRDTALGAWPVLLAQWSYMIGHGVHQPCGQAGVTGPFPQAAGAAAALAGCLLALLAFGVGAWLGVALDGTVQPLAHGVALAAALTSLSAWTLVRRLPR